jgi:hypothetical protein
MADKRALAEREVRRQEQARFLAVYEEIKAELLRIPGVVEVGVGLRERRGVLTDEGVFRVYVEEKRPESEVPPAQRIPPSIRGFPTDVITRRGDVLIIGFDDENDTRNYKTKVGGSQIGIDVSGSGTGTLGCFARLTSDNSVVILSCHHVLMEGGGNVGVGQPDHSSSWCCTCNEIARTIASPSSQAEPAQLDCAVARLKPDVKFAPKSRRIKKTDGTTELAGFIEGSDDPVKGDEVWKIGSRTGLTRGKLSEVAPRLEIHPLPPFPYVANHGDSGSVVVNTLTSKVVGLLRSIDKEIDQGGTLGYATPIGPVLALLGITIIPTDESQEFDVKAWDEERLGVTGPPTPDEVFAAAADRLNMTEAGAELLAIFRRHRQEMTALVNHRRPVTVAWHRAQGPSYLAAVTRSAREPLYRLPDSLNGVTRAEIAHRLRAVFTQYGSEALRADLSTHGDTLMRVWLECSTFDDMIRAWENAHAPAPMAG